MKLYFELATKIVDLVGTAVCGCFALIALFKLSVHPTDHQILVLAVWTLGVLVFRGGKGDA